MAEDAKTYIVNVLKEYGIECETTEYGNLFIRKKDLFIVLVDSMQTDVDVCHRMVLYITIEEHPMEIQPTENGVAVIIDYDSFCSIDAFSIITSLHDRETANVTSPAPASDSPAAKTRFTDSYGTSEDEFHRYCNDVTVSKIEWTEAKVKWSVYMSIFQKRQDFVEYIRSRHSGVMTTSAARDRLRDRAVLKPVLKPSPEKSEEDLFHLYVKKHGAASTKRYIQENFPNLPASVTHIDLKGQAFREAMKNLKETL